MINKWQKLLLAMASVFLLSSSGGDFSIQEANDVSEPPYQVNIHFFYSEYCSHCHEEKVFLDEIAQDEKYHNVTINRYLTDSLISGVEANPDYTRNNELLEEVADVFDIMAATPMTVMGGKAFSGFNATIKYSIPKYIEIYSEDEHVDVMSKIINGEAIEPGDIDTSVLDIIELPLIGIVDPKTVSLGLVSVVLGLVDGFNPCAMWVLLFLISLLLPNADRKRIFILGGAFILTSALFYFALMMAWVNTAVFIAGNLAFRIIVGAFALAAGGYNLYQFIKNIRQKDVGCEVTDEKQRVKLMDRVKKIVNQNKLILALLGVIALAVIVNFIEVACSAGLPLVFANILAINGLAGWSSLGYVLLYILFFIIDDLVVFTIVMLTLKIKVVSNKIARYNHLIGGIIMVAIGILMIFFPSILQFNF
jgi:thiol-disulfide isomerase/thioredoxin